MTLILVPFKYSLVDNTETADCPNENCNGQIKINMRWHYKIGMVCTHYKGAMDKNAVFDKVE